jgi:hypothetical protein
MARLALPLGLTFGTAAAIASEQEFAPESDRDGDDWSPDDVDGELELDVDPSGDINGWPPDDFDLEIDDEPEPEPGDFWLDNDDDED